MVEGAPEKCSLCLWASDQQRGFEISQYFQVCER